MTRTSRPTSTERSGLETSGHEPEGSKEVHKFGDWKIPEGYKVTDWRVRGYWDDENFTA